MQLPKITVVEGCKLQIAAMDSATTGKIGRKTINLTPYAGQVVRVWVNAKKTYSVTPGDAPLWQVAELAVPSITFETVTTKDPDTGEITEQSQAQPLNLDTAPVTLWPLPA